MGVGLSLELGVVVDAGAAQCRSAQLVDVDHQGHVRQDSAGVAGALTMGDGERAGRNERVGVALGEAAWCADGVALGVDGVRHVEVVQCSPEDGRFGAVELAVQHEATVEDSIEMQTVGGATELLGAVGRLGALHPSTHGELGGGHIEGHERLDDGCRLLGEQWSEPARDDPDDDIDLRLSQPALLPGRRHLGPLLETPQSGGLRRRGSATETGGVGEPSAHGAGAFVAPQLGGVEADLGLGHRRRETVEVRAHRKDGARIGGDTGGDEPRRRGLELGERLIE